MLVYNNLLVLLLFICTCIIYLGVDTVEQRYKANLNVNVLLDTPNVSVPDCSVLSCLCEVHTWCPVSLNQFYFTKLMNCYV